MWQCEVSHGKLHSSVGKQVLSPHGQSTDKDPAEVVAASSNCNLRDTSSTTQAPQSFSLVSDDRSGHCRESGRQRTEGVESGHSRG